MDELVYGRLRRQSRGSPQLGELDAEAGDRRAVWTRGEVDDAHRPAPYRAGEELGRVSCISCGVAQLYVGPASSSFAEQMNVRDSTLGHVSRVRTGPVALWALGVVRAAERPVLDAQSTEPLKLLG
jgi:hypothetical protein